MEKVKVGIIICDRYNTCAGGKCFRSAQNREGAFSAYKGMEIEIAGFTTCGGCPDYLTHMKLGTWNTNFLLDSVTNILSDEITRLKYD